MKTTYHQHALAASITLLAFTALTSIGYSQQADVEALAIAGEPVAGTNQTWSNFGAPRSNGDGGWVASATLRNPSGNYESVIVGDPSPDGSQGLSILRRASALGAFEQDLLERPDVVGDQIAYLANRSATTVSFEGAFLDDLLIAELGGPIGSTGETWSRLSDIFLRPGGKVFLRGSATGIGPVFYALHTDEILLQAGDPILGVPGTVFQLEELKVSPNGDHWVASVSRTMTMRRVLLLDGSPASIGNGLAVEGRLIDPALGFPGPRWRYFGRPSVEDTGRVSFQAVLTESTADITVRGDRLVNSPNEPLFFFGGTTDEGGALHLTFDALYLENQVVVNGLSTLDVDGDGVADPGYALESRPGYPLVGSVDDAQDQVIGSLFLTVPGGSSPRLSLVRYRRGLEGAVTCPGLPNSTGRAGQLTAFGDASVTANELTLLGRDFPETSVGYALASEQAGLVVNPGGSAGNLCLGGSIGRFDQSMVTVGASGQLSVTIDLTQIPGPAVASAVMSGDEWYFQVWNRDTVAGAATSNFSNAIAVTFTP